jgi:hypothetical protein
MRRTVVRIVLAVLLVTLGWAAGRTQSLDPDFELVVTGPPGAIGVECRRGCVVSWVERGVNPNARPMTTFSFSCKGDGLTSCSSGRIGGWLRPSER